MSLSRMDRLARFVGIPLALSACGGAPAKTGTPATDAPPPNPVSTASTRQEHETSAPGGEAPPELPGAPPPTDPGWDFHTWAYSRELEADLTSDGCEPARLGDKPDDTIWCRHHVDSKEGATLLSRALYVARNKRLVKLVELPVAAGIVENPDQPKDEKDRLLVNLELSTSSDGKKVSARLAAGFDCEKALQENDENRAVAKDLTRALDDRIKKVCASRGEWSWTGGTLRKTGR
ncbi:MAG: hypothetical protein U0263_00770 [Polyangiaceae bacterium]